MDELIRRLRFDNENIKCVFLSYGVYNDLTNMMGGLLLDQDIKTIYDVPYYCCTDLKEPYIIVEKDNRKLSREKENLFCEIMRLTDEYDCHDSIWWVTGEQYDDVTFFVNCNDLFYWGCGDCEEITTENISILAKSMKDVEKISEGCGGIYGTQLFCSRVRYMRPQGAAYPDDVKLWHLFDECGDIRKTGFGNPYEPGQYKSDTKR